MQLIVFADALQPLPHVLDLQLEHSVMRQQMVAMASVNAQQILHRVLECQLENFVTRRQIVEMESASAHRLLKHVAYQVKLVCLGLASAEHLHLAKI